MFRGLFQPLHLFIILIIALLVFGPGKLPQSGAAVGKGLRELKRVLLQKKEGGTTVTPDKLKNIARIVATKIYRSFFSKR